MEKFVLGDRSFDVPSPLPLKLLRIVEPAISNIIAMRNEKDRSSERYFTEIEKILCVLTGLTPDDVNNLQTSPQQLADAVDVAGIASCMWKKRDPNAGEAAPGEATGQTPPNQAAA